MLEDMIEEGVLEIFIPIGFQQLVN